MKKIPPDNPPQAWDDAGRSELIRRMRNSMALIRTVVRRSGERSEEVARFAARLDGRLQAYMFLTSGLLRDETRGLDLAIMVAEQLIAYGFHEGESLSIGGEDICLKGKAAEILGIAIHELAINAVEHGALSAPGGRVAVSWVKDQTEQGDRLQFSWAEDGLAAMPRFDFEGFGFSHLRKTLPYEIAGSAQCDIGPSSLIWTITIPL